MPFIARDFATDPMAWRCLDADADTDARDEDGIFMRPLHLAARADRDAIQFLYAPNHADDKLPPNAYARKKKYADSRGFIKVYERKCTQLKQINYPSEVQVFF